MKETKKLTKKLTLSVETLRFLNDIELNDVVGGNDTTVSTPTTSAPATRPILQCQTGKTQDNSIPCICC